MPSNTHSSGSGLSSGPREDATWRDVPIDWEALEDAFENNAPEVHSYLHVPTGDVLRIVDGIADPQMHARIAADTNYLRIEPVSSREQYRWMERYIPMIEDGELQVKLTKAIDGKGAFRRFKDVLMSYGPERERWFAFRSERLRIFMEAWLNAHALNPVKRLVWVPEMVEDGEPATAGASPEPRSQGGRNVHSQRNRLQELAESLGSGDLDTLTAFAEFLKAKRSKRRGASSAGSSAPDRAALPTGADDDAARASEPALAADADESRPTVEAAAANKAASDD